MQTATPIDNELFLIFFFVCKTYVDYLQKVKMLSI